MSRAKKSTRRVMNRQKCDARSCSSSVRPRGDTFSACRFSENVMHIPVCTAHGVARLFAGRRGAGEQLNARQVKQKKTCSAKHIHANNLGLNTSYI
jgi:hypothetical protein